MFKKMKIAQVYLANMKSGEIISTAHTYDDWLDNSDDDEKYNEENVLLRTSPS